MNSGCRYRWALLRSNVVGLKNSIQTISKLAKTIDAEITVMESGEFSHPRFKQRLKRAISLACHRAYRAGVRDNASKIRELLQIKQDE